ncbi:MAG TPA: H-X9-DG-CTERM domain-containing protein, partial [Verrucomicrobiae bacterium]|nr:H-X9-DG-CTERM domain-containing protein [Verrucomicrobiae bacterium]
LGLGGRSYSWDLAPVSIEATPESAVKQPSIMVALGDSFVRSASPVYDGAPGITSSFGPQTRYNALIVATQPMKRQKSFLNHHGKMNFGFCDGHVEVEDMNRQFVPMDENMRRWNNDNEPHREQWEKL